MLFSYRSLSIFYAIFENQTIELQLYRNRFSANHSQPVDVEPNCVATVVKEETKRNTLRIDQLRIER